MAVSLAWPPILDPSAHVSPFPSRRTAEATGQGSLPTLFPAAMVRCRGHRAGNLRLSLARSGDEVACPLVGRGRGHHSTTTAFSGLRGSPHHHLNFTQVARVDRLWLLGASGFLASQRRLVFQDNMGAAGRNDTVPEMGFGVWCWTGERATLIRRIPRLDRVMPVAQQRKDLGLGGGFMLQALGPRCGPTATLLPINSAPTQWA